MNEISKHSAGRTVSAQKWQLLLILLLPHTWLQAEETSNPRSVKVLRCIQWETQDE